MNLFWKITPPYGVNFFYFAMTAQLAGEPICLPDEVKQNLRGPRPARPMGAAGKGRPGEGDPSRTWGISAR